MNFFENFAVRVRKYPKLQNLDIWNKIRIIYLFFLKILTLNRGLRRTLYPGVAVQVSYASRQTMSPDFSITQQYDVPCLSLIQKWLRQKPDSCFFDVGANHGQFSLVVSRWISPSEKKIIAFEPHPENVKVLRENLARNRCTNVKVFDLALSSKKDRMTLYGDSVTASLQSSEGGQKYAVEVETLDGFCEQTGLVPDIMKIDVEGFEFEVLQGGLKTLTEHQETIRIICEMHTFKWNDPNFDLTTIKLAQSCGLNVFTLEGKPVQRIQQYGHYVLIKNFD